MFKSSSMNLQTKKSEKRNDDWATGDLDSSVKMRKLANGLKKTLTSRGGNVSEEITKIDAVPIVEPIDEATLRKMLNAFERKALKSRANGLKNSDDAARFMNSEIELNDTVQELHIINNVAAPPDLYAVLLQMNSAQTSTQLLSHANSEFLRMTANDKDIRNMTLCVRHVEFVPEWFLSRCLAVVHENRCARSSDLNGKVSKGDSAFRDDENALLEACLCRRFDYGKMLSRLRRLPFISIVAAAEFILQNLHDNPCTMEGITWIAVLIESHFMEWTIAADAHQVLVDLQHVISEEIDTRYSWLEIEGKIESLNAVSEAKKVDQSEDRKYWHSVIEY
ncbi:uncharacterized protein LOC129588026 isoform X1 [Paramacrobiotus metropolitanus]|uniref:uncharacterized protein LOC129588026 isoform X1 n=3 Tax=Paramacrobiotus metropolitanus TaxID=2943436 RepID=UPI002445900B|nr:uncharacterized protein LOC129588026 isoform X1 [Paramacrobiotus metropolitanus]